jgi:single-strand DNA-binding protein
MCGNLCVFNAGLQKMIGRSLLASFAVRAARSSGVVSKVLTRSSGTVNKVILIGIVANPPTALTETAKGTPVCNFSIGTETSTLREDGSNLLEWHQCVVFRSTANFCAQYLKKGMLVYVSGSIKYESFIDKTGVNRKVTKILGNSVEILRSPKDQFAGEAPKDQFAGESVDSVPSVQETHHFPDTVTH